MATITYPERETDDSRTVVTHHYGSSSTSVDSIHNRLTAIDVEAGGAVHSAASYAYMCSARRVALTLGGIIAMTFGGANRAPASGGGYPGLDQHGRPIDLHYTDTGGAIALPDGSAGTAGETVQRYQHRYDLVGNRKYARVELHPR